MSKHKTNTYDLTGEYGIGYTSSGDEFWFDLEDYDKIKKLLLAFDQTWIFESKNIKRRSIYNRQNISS